LKVRWVQFIGIFACFLCFLWMIGLGMTFNNYFNKGATPVSQPVELQIEETKEEPRIEPVKTGYHVVALGDSLTVGAGDVDGKGYVGYIIEQLNERSTEAVLENLAINGLTSDGLVKVLLQEQVQQQITTADLILVTIGGNDLFQGGQTLVELNLEEITLLEQQYLNNLNQILAEIRQLNKEATIYFSGLYHPFAELPNAEITTKVIIDWNHQTALEIAKFNKTVFVPTYDLFQYNLETYLSHDRFHPSAEGYQQMAMRIGSLIPWGGDDRE
jgi:lysophospholipase L1-like esterase